MNKQDELLANPPAEAVPPLRFFKSTVGLIRLVDSVGNRWAMVGEDGVIGLRWTDWNGSSTDYSTSPHWEEFFPTTDATVVEMPVPTDDDGPQIVEVPMIDPKVTALQEGFAEVLANPPEGIDTAVVKPFYDPNDNDVNLVDPDTRQTFGYWGEAGKRWYLTGSARYSEDKFDTLIRLRWTAGATTIEAKPEWEIKDERSDALDAVAEAQAEIATLTDQLADAQTNVEAHAQRIGELDDELRATYAEIAELGEQLLTVQSQRDDAESKLAEVHDFQIETQTFRVAHSDLLPMLQQKVKEVDSFRASSESYRQHFIDAEQRLAAKTVEAQRLANQLAVIRKMSKVV